METASANCGCGHNKKGEMKMLELLQAGFMEILMMAITTMAGVITVAVKKFLTKKGIITDMQKHEKLVGHVVKAVEQGYKDFRGDEKFEIAKDKIVELANEKGFKITDAEIETLIEACITEMKKADKEIVVKEDKSL